MELHHTRKFKKDIKNPEKDIYSKQYKSLEEEWDKLVRRFLKQQEIPFDEL